MKAAPLAADASDELKKGVSLYSLASMLQLFAQIQSYENDCERPETYCGVQVPAALQTRFGTMVVEFGDILAELLDLMLSQLRDEESGEGIVPTLDALTKIGGKPIVEVSDDVAELQKTIVAERQAFEKTIGSMAAQIDEVAKRIQTIEAQPMPMGASTVNAAGLKAVEKTADSTNVMAERTLEETLADPAAAEVVLGKLADVAIRNAQQRPIRSIIHGGT